MYEHHVEREGSGNSGDDYYDAGVGIRAAGYSRVSMVTRGLRVRVAQKPGLYHSTSVANMPETLGDQWAVDDGAGDVAQHEGG